METLDGNARTFAATTAAVPFLELVYPVVAGMAEIDRVVVDNVSAADGGGGRLTGTTVQVRDAAGALRWTKDVDARSTPTADGAYWDDAYTLSPLPTYVPGVPVPLTADTAVYAYGYRPLTLDGVPYVGRVLRVGVDTGFGSVFPYADAVRAPDGGLLLDDGSGTTANQWAPVVDGTALQLHVNRWYDQGPNGQHFSLPVDNHPSVIGSYLGANGFPATTRGLLIQPWPGMYFQGDFTVSVWTRRLTSTLGSQMILGWGYVTLDGFGVLLLDRFFSVGCGASGGPTYVVLRTPVVVECHGETGDEILGPPRRRSPIWGAAPRRRHQHRGLPAAAEPVGVRGGHAHRDHRPFLRERRPVPLGREHARPVPEPGDDPLVLPRRVRQHRVRRRQHRRDQRARRRHDDRTAPRKNKNPSYVGGRPPMNVFLTPQPTW
jgi:hypothetical protein